jgi:hypothetical protein
LLIFVELLTITVQTLFCFVDIGGIGDHHCSNFLLVCWFNKPKESFNCDGQQFLQYQQTKRKCKQWWSTILPLSFVLLILDELLTISVNTFFCFIDIGWIVDHHC